LVSLLSNVHSRQPAPSASRPLAPPVVVVNAISTPMAASQKPLACMPPQTVPRQIEMATDTWTFSRRWAEIDAWPIILNSEFAQLPSEKTTGFWAPVARSKSTAMPSTTRCTSALRSASSRTSKAASTLNEPASLAKNGVGLSGMIFSNDSASEASGKR